MLQATEVQGTYLVRNSGPNRAERRAEDRAQVKASKERGDVCRVPHFLGWRGTNKWQVVYD